MRYYLAMQFNEVVFNAMLIMQLAVSGKMSHPVALGCPLTLTCEANKVRSNLNHKYENKYENKSQTNMKTNLKQI